MKIAKLGILVGMLVLLVGLAQAAANFTCEITTPATSNTISVDDYNVTITITSGGQSANATWCALTIQDNANGTASQLIRNISLPARGDKANFTGLNLSGIMYDSRAGYTFNGTCGNSTDLADCTDATSVKSNFGSPLASITSPTSGAANDQGLTVSGDCKNASSATLWLDGNSYTMTMVGSGNTETCSYTFGSLSPSDGAYQAYIVSKDQNDDQTTSSVINLIVNAAKKGKGAIMGALATQQQAQEQQQIDQATKSSNMTIVVIIAAIVVVGYVVFGGKGKK